MNFSDKYPGEDEYLGFNFAPRLGAGETISSVSFAVAVLRGTDPAAAAMLSGVAAIDGAVVKQLVVDGVAGAHYRVSATIITSAGQTLIESGDLVVKEIG